VDTNGIDLRQYHLEDPGVEDIQLHQAC